MDGNTYLDTLVSYALCAGDLAAGLPLEVVRARNPEYCALVSGAPYQPSPHGASWSYAEDDYLRTHLGFIPESEMATQLGRSPVAVHLRWSRDLKLPAPLRHPDYLTGRKIADLLGRDEHAVMYWLTSGLLASEIVASDSGVLRSLGTARSPRTYRRVKKVILLRWLIDPDHWIWFEPNQVPDPRLRRLLELKAARWGDAWWTARQVADYHRVDVKDVLRLIKRGEIAAVQARNRGGRDNGGWAFWYVRRSEATRPDLHFVKGRGKSHGEISNWSERADAFLILARAVGNSTNAIAAMMGWRSNRVGYRLAELVWSGKIAGLVEKYRLPVEWRPLAAGDFSAQLFADWRLYCDRFPRLARAMDRFRDYLAGKHIYPKPHRHGSHPDLLPVCSVLRAWTAWHLGEWPGRLQTGSLSGELLSPYYWRLVKRGFDPLEMEKGL